MEATSHGKASIEQMRREYNAAHGDWAWRARRTPAVGPCKLPEKLNPPQERAARAWLAAAGRVIRGEPAGANEPTRAAASAAREYANETGTPPHLVRQALLEGATPPAACGAWGSACAMWQAAKAMDVRAVPVPAAPEEVDIADLHESLRRNWTVVVQKSALVTSQWQKTALETMRGVARQRGGVWRFAQAVALAIYLKSPGRAAAIAADLESCSGTAPTIGCQFDIVRKCLERYAEAAPSAAELAAEFESLEMSISLEALAALSAFAA